MARRHVLEVLLLLGISARARGSAPAEEIEVPPGEGTIQSAVSKAGTGHVFKLRAGEYKDSVLLPEGTIIRGAGADKTVVIATGGVVFNCRGSFIQVLNLELRSSSGTLRGVSSDQPVFISGCRFRGFRQAVGLMRAPLSDVVHCEFIDCEIGIRAIGRASPGVEGCRFQGGRIGVLCVEGTPYIRNNLFLDQESGVVIATDRTAIVRNNVFWRCSRAGVEVQDGKGPLGIPSIRNSIFHSCAAAVVCSKEKAKHISDAIVCGAKFPEFRDKKGEEIVHLGNQRLRSFDPDLSIDASGQVVVGKTELLAGKGIRLCSEEKDAVGDIGLSPGWERPGVNPLGASGTRGDRFSGLVFRAHGVHEEYDFLSVMGLRSTSQSLLLEGRQRIDLLRVTQDGREREFRFDVTGFYGEESLGD